MPIWVGVLLIGLMEFFIGAEMTEIGFMWGGLLMFNSIWFMLLFVPTLFYSPTYRKALLIVYTVTTVLNTIAIIAETVGLAMLSGDEEQFDKFFKEIETITAESPAGPMAGDNAAYGTVIAYLRRASGTYDFQRPDDVTEFEWERKKTMDAAWTFQIDLLVNLVFLRWFYNVVLMKFQKEGEWLKQATGEETAASHPCRPMCCGGCMSGTKM